MAHRKVDVDSHILDDDDADVGVQHAVDTVNPVVAAANAVAAANEVNGLLTRGNVSGALARALEQTSAVYGAAEELTVAKDTITKAVIDVLSAAKPPEVPNFINALQPQQRDLLLKYLYRGMTSPQSYNCGVLLLWHEKLVEVTGIGSIVRVMADSRRV